LASRLAGGPVVAAGQVQFGNFANRAIDSSEQPMLAREVVCLTLAKVSTELCRTFHWLVKINTSRHSPGRRTVVPWTINANDIAS
jgi:hypothetical protein